jgi:hypothetical protein
MIPKYMQRALGDVYEAWAKMYVLDAGDEDMIVALGRLRDAIHRSEGKAHLIFDRADRVWATLPPGSIAGG